jgi:glycosyltransferase involved in cell wall biosynthesis
MGELVLVAGRDPTRQHGGSESYVIAIARCARSLGLEPHVFVTGRRSERIEAEFGTVHRVRSFASMPPGHTARLHRAVLVRAVVKWLRHRPGPHVIHGTAGWSRAACVAAERLRGSGVDARALASMYSAVAHEQGAKRRSGLVRSEPHLWLKYTVLDLWARTAAAREERAGYLDADAVTVNYENVRRLLAEAYGWRTQVQRVAYCAPAAFADGDGLGERVESGAAPLIVSVSRHSMRKGLDVLVRALAELRDTGVAFRAQLVGDGAAGAANRELAAELGLGGLVEFTGVVPDPVPYLRACDVFVHHTLAEDSGSVAVLEALQCGAAIVCSDVDGLPEDLTQGQDGLLVAPGDAHALADAIGRLLGDAELRARLSRGARATYEARFTPQRAIADLAGVYRGLGLDVPAGVQ